MSRRELLLLAWSILASRGPRDAALTQASALTDALFGSRESARVIGEAYLGRYPSEGDRDRLVRLLNLPNERTREEILQFVAERQRLDFDLSRVVRVNGWVLSETEARICALVALG